MSDEAFKQIDFELRELVSKIIAKVDQIYFGALEEMTEAEKNQFIKSLRAASNGLYKEINESIVQKARQMDEMRQLNETIAEELGNAKSISENILRSILPEDIIEELTYYGKVRPRKIDNSIIVFIDIVNFTRISELETPDDLMDKLDYFFSLLDALSTKYGLERIKLIGDCYMCAGNITGKETSPEKTILMCLELIDILNEDAKLDWKVRIGVNIGTVIAGIAGTKRYLFDIWGDAVNIAARLVSQGEPNKINISEDLYKTIKNEFNCIERGLINTKNKGMILMYFVEGKNIESRGL